MEAEKNSNSEKFRIFLSKKAERTSHLRKPTKQQHIKYQSQSESHESETEVEDEEEKQKMEKSGNHLEGQEWLNFQEKNHHQKIIEMKDYKNNVLPSMKITFFERQLQNPIASDRQNQLQFFVDQEFPPNQHSLCGQWGYPEKWKDVYWQLASKILKHSKVFEGKVQPQDIKQGRLGDCYFLAALAALSERPDRIFKLFNHDQQSSSKGFEVQLLFKGKWKVIKLDEYFPFLKDKPALSKSHKDELWVMLLEKAWAKLYSSYMRISSGHAEDPFHDLTGCPIKFINLKDKKFKKEKFWKYMLKASKRQYSMCISSNKGSDTKMSQTGIVQGHAYTVLKVVELRYEGEIVKLMKLRNPWGKKQGQGKWGDLDRRWKEVSKQEKRRIGFHKKPNDGTFFIELDELLVEYRAITIAEINDNANYIYDYAYDPQKEGVYFKVEIQQVGKYSFQLDKTPKRCFEIVKQKSFKYPQTVAIIYHIKSDKAHKIKQFNSNESERLSSKKIKLGVGTYFVYAWYDFNPKFQNEYEVLLAIYSQEICKIQVATESQKNTYFSQRKVMKRSKTQPKLERQQLRARRRMQEDGSEYQFGAHRNSSNLVIQSKPRRVITFNYATNNSVINPNNHTISNTNTNNFIELLKNNDGLKWLKEQVELQKCKLVNAEIFNIATFIDTQIVYLEKSDSNATLEDLRRNKILFVDQKFPPCLNSLTGEWKYLEKWKNIRWERISKVLPSAKIFLRKMEPSSIKQGFLGDCYFLAGIAALVERPDRILNLFLIHERNQCNFYSVKLLYRGKWKTIDIDDWIPFNYTLPAFSQSDQGQLWVMILEKAWAKLYNNFKRIEAGFPEETLHDLTGAPIKKINLKKANFDKEAEWIYLKKSTELLYSMVVSSTSGSDMNKSYIGIVQGHAYTLLKAIQLQFEGRKQRLLQLRNPWGKGESKGRWSDNDPEWQFISPQEKFRVGYQNKDDGIFFISYDDFCQEFKMVTIAEINDNASYVYQSFPDPLGKGCFFSVEIMKKGYYSFQVNNTPERSFEDNLPVKYHYPLITFQLGRVRNQAIQKLLQVQSNERAIYSGINLEPAKYICFAQIEFNKQFENEFEVNLAVYGDYGCEIKSATREEAIGLSNNIEVRWQQIS